MLSLGIFQASLAYISVKNTHDALCMRCDFGIMRDHYNCSSLFIEFVEDFHDLFACFLVQCTRRFIRKQNLRELCAPLGENFLVIANIPYNITTPIFEVLWESGLSIRQISVMIQKEVAQRLCAAPGTGEYGAFSVLVQWYAEPKLLFDVPPHCFVPQPKVTSAVVRMDRRAAPPASVDDKKLFFRTVRAAFAQRRKTLSNALRSGFSELDRAAIESAMEETGLPPAVRGETLSIAQFAALSNALLRKFDK